MNTKPSINKISETNYAHVSSHYSNVQQVSQSVTKVVPGTNYVQIPAHYVNCHS